MSVLSAIEELPRNAVMTTGDEPYLASDDNGSTESSSAKCTSESSRSNPESSKLCEDQQCPDIVHGEPLTDRKSTFQAHAATVYSKQEVRVYSWQ